MVVERFEHSDVTGAPDSVALSRPLPTTLRQDSEIQFRCRSTISSMVVERFGHSDVTAAPDTATRSRFHCPEPFGKTQKSSINAGERSLL